MLLVNGNVMSSTTKGDSHGHASDATADDTNIQLSPALRHLSWLLLVVVRFDVFEYSSGTSVVCGLSSSDCAYTEQVMIVYGRMRQAEFIYAMHHKLLTLVYVIASDRLSARIGGQGPWPMIADKHTSKHF